MIEIFFLTANLHAIEVGQRVDELTTSTGRTYKMAVVTKVFSDGITIVHEDGVARIPLLQLPADLTQGMDLPSQEEIEQRQALERRHQARLAQEQAQQLGARQVRQHYLDGLGKLPAILGGLTEPALHYGRGTDVVRVNAMEGETILNNLRRSLCQSTPPTYTTLKSIVDRVLAQGKVQSVSFTARKIPNLREIQKLLGDGFERYRAEPGENTGMGSIEFWHEYPDLAIGVATGVNGPYAAAIRFKRR